MSVLQVLQTTKTIKTAWTQHQLINHDYLKILSKNLFKNDLQLKSTNVLIKTIHTV